MNYDSKMIYTSQYFQTLTTAELVDLFQQAKQALNVSYFSSNDEKKKMRGDIQVMRVWLKYHTGVNDD